MKPMVEGNEPDLCVSNLPLVIGVSTRALFDLEEEHEVFERKGVLAYSELQRQRENIVLKPGAAFEVARRLLALNPKDAPKLVEIVVLSKKLARSLFAGIQLVQALRPIDYARKLHKRATIGSVRYRLWR